MQVILNFTTIEWVTIVGVFITLVGVIYAGVTFHRRRGDKAQSNTQKELNQISRGSNSPNINTKGDVKLSFGDKNDE